MNLPVLSMPYNEAREAVRDYRRAHTKNDKAILACYRAIARGKRVISIIEAIAGGGVDQHNRPRLAICRAHCQRVFLRREGWETRFAEQTWLSRRHTKSWMTFRNLGYVDRRIESEAWVPSIPPRFRPADHQLREHHILWEAEWSPAPPVDPVLLKLVRWPFFAVLAHWNLTPVERAVIGL